MDKNVDQCFAAERTVAHPCLTKSVLVLLLASIERFGVFRMRDFFGIGATIRIGRDIQCLPYAEFLSV